MRAVVLEGRRRVRVREVPVPDRDGRTVVRVQRVGLCGTDHKIVEGEIPVQFPRVLGHEILGEVVDPGAADGPAIGTRVLIDPSSSCGRCALCRRSLDHLCRLGRLMGRDRDGGLAEFVAVDALHLHPIPDAVGDDDASVAQVLGTCVHAQRLVDVFPGDVAVVVGLGVAGLLHVQLLRARGVRTVIGVTRSALRREMALSIGASAVAAPEEAADTVRDATDGRGGDVVVEAVGQVTTLGQVIELACPGGTVLVFGTVTAGTGQLRYYDLYFKELRVLSSRAARPRDYADAIALLAAKAVEGAPLVSARISLDDAAAAFAHWREDQRQLKVVVDV